VSVDIFSVMICDMVVSCGLGLIAKHQMNGDIFWRYFSESVFCTKLLLKCRLRRLSNESIIHSLSNSFEDHSSLFNHENLQYRVSFLSLCLGN
jgi:hypothetical protein